MLLLLNAEPSQQHTCKRLLMLAFKDMQKTQFAQCKQGRQVKVANL